VDFGSIVTVLARAGECDIALGSRESCRGTDHGTGDLQKPEDGPAPAGAARGLAMSGRDLSVGAPLKAVLMLQAAGGR
jgi:hypothetical protein